MLAGQGGGRAHATAATSRRLVGDDHRPRPQWASSHDIARWTSAYSIRKADVDSFLSESARAQFSFRLLIATTDHLGPTAKRTIDAQEKQVSVLLRTARTALNVEWPSSLEDLRTAKTMRPPTPRPYQRRAVQAVVDGLGKHDLGTRGRV